MVYLFTVVSDHLGGLQSGELNANLRSLSALFLDALDLRTLHADVCAKE